MRAVVKDGIGVFNPQGFLDGTNTPTFLTIEDIQATKQLKINMLLVSLKKVIFFNKNGLDVFVKMLVEVRNESKVSIGFCDYDTKKYQAILKFYGDSINFSLFKSQKVAALFASTNKEEKLDVLVYNDDPSQRSSMAIELFDHGHNPIIAQSKAEFEEKKQNKDNYNSIIENTFLGLYGQKIATRVTGNAIIYTISNFIDAEVSETFDFSYHTNSLNVGFRLFIFDAYKVLSMNIHAVNFFSKLASTAAEYNANFVFVGMKFDKTPISFKEELEDAGFMFFEELDDILKDKELLKELGAVSVSASKSKRLLTKGMVNELPRFIDASVTTLEMMTNATAEKDNVKIDELVISKTEGMLASSIGFYGDMDGMVILVLPFSIAKSSCELLLDEATDDIEIILDSLAELVNIVGGRIKTLLSEDDISINITLPRTYEDVESLLDLVSNTKGVQVDLKFKNEKFTFFLTR